MTALALALALIAFADPVTEVEALAAYEDVYTVLMHPRCLNCHPNGDAPLWYADATPHGMLIDRFSPNVGLPCTTCHSPDRTFEAPHLPPSAPGWGLPPRYMQFQDRSPAELCAQLNDPATTGGRDLQALVTHVTTDHLVATSWDRGIGFPPPPISHQVFSERFAVWVEAGAPCPAP